MHDQRLVGLPCSLDVGHETLALPVEITGLMEIIEPGFADGDHGFACRQGTEFINRRFANILVVRVHADRAVDVLIGPDTLVHRLEGIEIDADTEHAGHAGRVDFGQQSIEIRVICFEIDMIEMAV